MNTSNWMTSLAGVAAGGLNLLANGTNWKQVLVSVALAAIGIVAKQFNVTGGTVLNTNAAPSTPVGTPSTK